MKAIILNAGKGGRLAPLTDACPKCLIDIGGRTLLDYQLDSLRNAGVTDLVMVLGYRQEAIREHLARFPEFSVTYIENNDYANTNTAYSLWLARHEMTSDFLYFNGDVLFHPELVNRLVNASADNALAVERKPCGDEEVKVILDGTRITVIGKEVDPGSAYGEFIGIARFSATIGPLFRKTLEKVIEQQHLLTNYFETAVDLMLEEGIFTAVDISDLPCIEIDFPDDLSRARDLVLPNIQKNKAPKRRILFYVQRDLQLPFLEPIHDWLKANHPEMELAFSAPQFIVPHNGNPGWGLPEKEVGRLRQKSRFVRTVEEFAPDVTAFADACTNIMNCGKRVFVGHGIISKGGFYTTNPMVRRENLADLICVPGPWHREILEQNVFSPIVVTGFIKSDRLFGPVAATREEFCRRLAIPQDKRIILYAPTFNTELSAVPCLGERILELCDPDTYLIIKLHTMSDILWVEMHRRLADNHPHVRYLDDLDVTPAMAAADLLISDVSSVLVEFMSLDRPVIAVNNPRQKEYEGYVPTDIEYLIRDACTQVNTMEELKIVVKRSLAAPEELSEKRRHYADSLCYGRDGKSGQRAAEAILQLLQDSFAILKPRERFTIVLISDTDIPENTIQETMLNVLKANVGLDIEFLNRCGQALRNQDIVNASGSFIVFLKPGTALPDRWLEFLSNYFRWHTDTGMVRTLSTGDNYQDLITSIFPELGHPEPSEVSSLLVSTLMGRDMPMTQIASGCVMVKRDLIPPDLSSQSNNSVAGYLSGLAENLSTSGYSNRLALDIFSYAIHTDMPNTEDIPDLIQAYLADPLNRDKARTLADGLISLSLRQDALDICKAYLHAFPDDREFMELADSIDIQLTE